MIRDGTVDDCPSIHKPKLTSSIFPFFHHKAQQLHRTLLVYSHSHLKFYCISLLSSFLSVFCILSLISTILSFLLQFLLQTHFCLSFHASLHTIQFCLLWVARMATNAVLFVLVKRFCEPKKHRRSWLVWFYDTSKQGLGAMIVHFCNVFLSEAFKGDPCTWWEIYPKTNQFRGR